MFNWWAMRCFRTSPEESILRVHLLHCLLVNLEDGDNLLPTIRKACLHYPAVLDYHFLRETFIGAVFLHFTRIIKDPDAVLSRFVPLTTVPAAKEDDDTTGTRNYSYYTVNFSAALIDKFPLKQRKPPKPEKRCVLASLYRKFFFFF